MSVWCWFQDSLLSQVGGYRESATANEAPICAVPVHAPSRWVMVGEVANLVIVNLQVPGISSLPYHIGHSSYSEGDHCPLSLSEGPQARTFTAVIPTTPTRE